MEDTSGCIPCTVWFESTEHAATFEELSVGTLVEVNGRIKVFRGLLELTVNYMEAHIDPNLLTLHILECLNGRKKLISDSFTVTSLQLIDVFDHQLRSLLYRDTIKRGKNLSKIHCFKYFIKIKNRLCSYESRTKCQRTKCQKMKNRTKCHQKK